MVHIQQMPRYIASLCRLKLVLFNMLVLKYISLKVPFQKQYFPTGSNGTKGFNLWRLNRTWILLKKHWNLPASMHHTRQWHRKKSGEVGREVGKQEPSLVTSHTLHNRGLWSLRKTSPNWEQHLFHAFCFYAVGYNKKTRQLVGVDGMLEFMECLSSWNVGIHAQIFNYPAFWKLAWW